MSELVEYFQSRDRFANWLGARLLRVERGRARAELQVEERHLNAAGVLHGGVIFSLADFVFAAASNSYGKIALAISANIQFVRGVTGGKIFAEAKEITSHPRLASYDIRITDEEENIVATFQGIVYRKDKELPGWPEGE